MSKTKKIVLSIALWTFWMFLVCSWAIFSGTPQPLFAVGYNIVAAITVFYTARRMAAQYWAEIETNTCMWVGSDGLVVRKPTFSYYFFRWPVLGIFILVFCYIIISLFVDGLLTQAGHANYKPINFYHYTYMRWAAESLYICCGNIMAAIEYHLRQEKKKQAAIENLHQARLEVGEQTMKQVGRELHDSVGISLSLGRMRLQQLAQQLPAAEKELNEVAGLILDGLNRVRSISHGLHATHLQNEGLQAALEEEFTKTAESGQYQKQFSIQGESFFMDDNRELLVYRIAQEALHNIVKHANATTIHMHLQYTPTQFKLQLVDDGVGLPANYGGGMGMKNMHLRAASLGGRFEVAPGPQGGTVVELLVPQG